MAEVATTKPLPALSKLSAPFWEGTKNGELRLQRCLECGHRWHPPSTHCPSCLSRNYEWQASSGRGRVWSWILMHQRYFEGFDPPYVVAFVELEEGVMLMTNLVEVDKESIRCDMPVTVTFDRRTDEMAVPQFRPA